MTPPPDRGPVTVDTLIRWCMKALELARLIYAAGYDVDAELTRLHRMYDLRRDTARIRLGLSADEGKE